MSIPRYKSCLVQPVPEVEALENKRYSLVGEEMQVGEVLTSHTKFRISQSAQKKDEFYASVAPDFADSPPVQYISRSSQNDDGEATDTMEWFQLFGDRVTEDILKR